MSKAPKTRNAYPSARGNLKREARAIANARVNEGREPQFMHSVARRRAFPDEYPTPRPMTGALTPEQRRMRRATT
jgi:hypothetical protein